ncbi:TolC family protein [Halomonas sp.]|uniref:TolC family protein n=1 Tax=Halomonas sp. TaxID=1486246 RepID=UPI003D11A7C2
MRRDRSRRLVALTPLALAVALSAQAQEPGAQQPPAGDEALSALAELEAAAEQSAQRPLPQLPLLVERAMQNDVDLSRQRYELQASEREIDKAWAQLKPQLSASASYQYQQGDNYYTDNPSYDPSNERVDPDNEARYEGTTRDTLWQVSLSQPLFSLERWRGVDRAEQQVDAAELDLALVERDLALSVSEAYLNAFTASRKLATLNAQQEALDLQVRQAQRAYELGVGDRINLLEAQSRFDQAIADAVQAENELDDALSELERLTGLRPDFGEAQLGEVDDVSLDELARDEQEWLASIGNNLDVLRAQAEQAIARSDTRVRRSGYYPELNLNLSYSDRASNDPFRESQDARASVQLEVPIYRGGYTTANVEQGELSAMAAQEALDNQRNLTAQEVRSRLRSLNGNSRRMEALQQAIESSQLFLEAAERGEQLGLRDLVDVLDARSSLYDQRIQFIETLGRYAQDRLALEAAIGNLGTDDLQQTMRLLAQVVPTD